MTSISTDRRQEGRQTDRRVRVSEVELHSGEAAVVGIRISQDKLEKTSKIDKAALR